MLKKRLLQWPDAAVAVFTLVAGFGTYFSMYAFRKPFAVAQYADASSIWGHLDFKIAIIIAQVLGYALSKLIGIKVIAEMRPGQRFTLLLGFTTFAGLALLGFGLAQGSAWSLLWLFLNGLPLGMIWGIVFSYMEGRRLSEFLGACLCASFIVASWAVKSVCAWLMLSWQVDAYWMPFYTGMLFLPLLVTGGWMLEQIPAPSTADQLLRTKREPMSRSERVLFFRQYAPGLLALVFCYIMVTIFRDFRDNFAAELWSAIGFGQATAIYTLAEIPIAVLVLVMLALTMFIQDNARAFLLYHWLMLGGCLIMGGATFLFNAGILRGDWWMILVGAGLYVIYVPFNAILFDRMIAAFRQVATAGFLIYLADSAGYGGSVAALLYKNFGQTNLSWLDFFTTLSYFTAVFSGLMILFALLYFKKIIKKI